MKTKYNGWQNLALINDMSGLEITRKDSKGRIISQGIEVF
jgi:hypothetical protein